MNKFLDTDLQKGRERATEGYYPEDEDEGSKAWIKSEKFNPSKNTFDDNKFSSLTQSGSTTKRNLDGSVRLNEEDENGPISFDQVAEYNAK